MIGNGCYWWLNAFDSLRRLQGQTLDLMGLGRQEADYDLIYTRPGARLRAYGGGSGAPALVILPAPIKGPYAWDLCPERSVVRRAREQGLSVYMIEWTEPAGLATDLGLVEYAATIPDECLDVIAKRQPGAPVILAGHSLGGTFAALHAAWRPESAAAVLLIEAPVRFGEQTGAFRKALARNIPANSVVADAQRLPGSLLSLLAAGAAPGTFQLERQMDYTASLTSPEDLHNHWRALRWTLDELPMSRQLFEDVVEVLYREDRFMRGQLMFGRRQLAPEQVKAPLLVVYDPDSRIVPAESSLDFFRKTNSQRKDSFAYRGDTGVALQHLGPLIGANAHRDLWPRIFHWLHQLQVSH